MPRAPQEPKVVIYFDYNGVLNSGGNHDQRSMLRAMNIFCAQLKARETGYISMCVLSYSGWGRSQKTLKELDNAGVLNLFEKIIFTTEPFSGDVDQLAGRSEDHIYHSKRTLGNTIAFICFRGGKDAYLRSHYGPDCSSGIMFIDDKHKTLYAVHRLLPRVHLVELTDRYFLSDPRICTHVHNLSELYSKIDSFDRVQRLRSPRTSPSTTVQSSLSPTIALGATDDHAPLESQARGYTHSHGIIGATGGATLGATDVQAMQSTVPGNWIVCELCQGCSFLCDDDWIQHLLHDCAALSHMHS